MWSAEALKRDRVTQVSGVEFFVCLPPRGQKCVDFIPSVFLRHTPMQEMVTACSESVSLIMCDKKCDSAPWSSSMI